MKFPIQFLLRAVFALVLGFSVTSCELLNKDSGFAPRELGTLQSSIHTLDAGRQTACEHPWTVRMNIYHPSSIVPRRSYFNSCTEDDGSTSYMTSLTLKDGTSEHGAIIKTDFDNDANTFGDSEEFHYSECEEMHGIAGGDSCSVNRAALCRRASEASESASLEKDMVAAISEDHIRNWLTQPNNADELVSSGSGLSAHSLDEVWLYEWPTGELDTTAGRYVAHKAFGGWEYGNNFLLYGDDDTYLVALKTAVYDPQGQDHQADSMMVVDRSDFSFDTSRGYYWACGHGHTTFNRPAYNPATGKYANLCTTDGNDSGDANEAGLFLRMEDKAYNDFYRIYVGDLNILIGGGNGALHPLEDGGYLGVIVANKDISGRIDDGFRGGEPTKIGLVEFDEDGNLVGGIRWVAEHETTFYSFPQLVPLGDGSFVLGYGVMRDIAGVTDFEDNTEDEFYRVATEYVLLEVDKYGEVLTEPMVTDAGWGEQDGLINIGYGKVAWTYIPGPTIDEAGSYSSCNSSDLQMNVYTSTIANSGDTSDPVEE